jgi:amino acid transporter
MSELVTTPSAAPPDRASDARPARREHLEGRVGVIELVLTVLAWSAPIVVVTAFTPIIVIYGGVGAPLAYAVSMGVLLLFAVGYIAMTNHISNPGAFYAYITQGLGRVPGLGASLVALLSYYLMGLGTYTFLGAATSSVVADIFGGPTLSWHVYTLGGIFLVGTLGYFRIDLSAKVLGVAMLLEVLIVLVFDAAVFFRGGEHGLALDSFAPSSLSSSGAPIAILFAATCFGGFEATAIFREETKDPRKTVSRATFAAVLSIGVFYILATWFLIAAYGSDKALGAATSDPVGMFPAAVTRFVGAWASDAVSILVVTSAAAATLACQNIMSRYSFSLGVDQVMPSVLGKVHPRHHSPYVSSLAVTALMTISVFVLWNQDPLALYGRIAGTGGFGVMLLMTLTSVAVVVFFRRRGNLGSTVWQTLVAPVASALGMAVVLYLALTHFKLMTGGSTREAILYQVLVWGVLAFGMVLALFYRAKRPEVYARIGRQRG